MTPLSSCALPFPLQEVMQHKLIFIETQDVVETTLALDNYRRWVPVLERGGHQA